MTTRTFTTRPRNNVPLSRAALMRSLRAPLMEAAKSYLIAQHQLSEITRNNYRVNLEAFDRWLLAGGGTTGDLTAENVNVYAAETVKRGRRYMARNVVATLKCLDKWLAANNIVEAPQLQAVKLPRVPQEGRAPFTDDEVRTILAISRHTRYGPRDYAIVTLGLGCGLRLNEMAELKLDDVDFDQGVLTVRAETSKSGRERQVVLDAVAAAALDTYIKDWRKPATGDRHVFMSNRDRPFTRESFCNVFDALRVAMHKAGVDGFMCHRLRHTWATNAHRVGLSVFDIQEQGGWKKLDMVRRYTKSRPISELRRMPTSLAGMLKRRGS